LTRRYGLSFYSIGEKNNFFRKNIQKLRINQNLLPLEEVPLVQFLFT
jgi:hypothetical protein